MLTRFVRIQLVIFTIVGIIGVIVMVVFYIQAPTLLGIGRMTVTLELPATGGLYRFSNVTYRGVQVGKVTAVGLTPTGAKATLSLGHFAEDPRGPDSGGAQRLRGGRAVRGPAAHAPTRRPICTTARSSPCTTPRFRKPVGPDARQVSALVNSIPRTNSANCSTSRSRHSTAPATISGRCSTLRRSCPATPTASPTAPEPSSKTPGRCWMRRPRPPTRSGRGRAAWPGSPAVVTDDSQFRTLLQNGPGAADEASRLLDQIKPTLPVLLANLTTIGQIGVTYHASLEQLLVLLPPFIAAIQTLPADKQSDRVWPPGDFALTISDPPACTVGFLPPSQWRSPADTTDIDTPDGLYCKLPQDSPIAVRGARNYPCMGTRASARPPSKSATATSHTCRWRCGSTRSAPTRWIRTCSRRASRPMTGSTRTAQNLRPGRGNADCHRERFRRGRPAGRRGETTTDGAGGFHSPARRRVADTGNQCPDDGAKRCSPGGASRCSARGAKCCSAGCAGRCSARGARGCAAGAERCSVCGTECIRTQWVSARAAARPLGGDSSVRSAHRVATSPRTATFIASRTSSPKRALKRGRTCFPDKPKLITRQRFRNSRMPVSLSCPGARAVRCPAGVLPADAARYRSCYPVRPALTTQTRFRQSPG